MIAHPPCRNYSALKHLATGDDSDCAPRANRSRCACGACCLEHPATSTLWNKCGLPGPGELPDAWGGFTVVVNQSDWGHPARKRTRLYIVRTNEAHRPPLHRGSRPIGAAAAETRHAGPCRQASRYVRLSSGDARLWRSPSGSLILLVRWGNDDRPQAPPGPPEPIPRRAQPPCRDCDAMRRDPQRSGRKAHSRRRDASPAQCGKGREVGLCPCAPPKKDTRRRLVRCTCGSGEMPTTAHNM